MSGSSGPSCALRVVSVAGQNEWHCDCGWAPDLHEPPVQAWWDHVRAVGAVPPPHEPVYPAPPSAVSP